MKIVTLPVGRACFRALLRAQRLKIRKISSMSLMSPLSTWAGAGAGRVLPPAIIGMLVVYCLRNLEFSAASGWLPAVIAGAAVAALQALTRRSLVSILGGTALYMVLVNFL